jgi:hypothetical protein
MARRPLLVVVLVAALATGCGSKGSQTAGSTTPPANGNGNGVLLQAASATQHTGSARMTMDVTMPSPEGTLQMHATGAYVFHGHVAGELHMNMNAAGTSLTMDERIIGTTIYMRSPLLTRQIPGAKPWLKFDLAKLGKSMGVNFGAILNSSSTSDPTQSLTYLEASSNSIQNLGTQQIDGVTTTHYHAVVDMRKAMKLLAARAPAGQRAAVRSTYQHLIDQTGVITYPMDVWVDDQGLVRQMHMQMPMPNSGESMDMTMKLSDFGAPVKVSAPPASQVTDLLKLLQHSSTA